MKKITNYKFHSTGQYRNVCKNIKTQSQYLGYDEEKKEPIIDTTRKAPVLRYLGTTKLHGTNASIVLHADGTISFHSKSQLLGYVDEDGFTLKSDNAEFAQSMSRRMGGVFEILNRAKAACINHLGDVRYPLKISGEWCGCFHYNTPIKLADGSTEKIGVIVNKKLPVEVLSYNQDTGKIEAKKVVNWFNNGTTEDWLTITYKRRGRGGKGLSLNVTPNHHIFTKEKGQLIEKQAGDLKVGDTLFLTGKRLSHKARQFIKGSLLGDMWFNNKRSVAVSHSKDNQPHYIPFINNLLDGVVREGTSGVGSNMETFHSTSYPEIEDMYETLCSGGKKNPTEKYLEDIGVVGLAAWYMDDGSLIDQGSGRQPQCELHTLGFDIENTELISKWLTSRGYESYTIDRSKRYGKPCAEIRFTIEGASAFLEDIAPYVLEGFNYKLPNNLRKVPKIDILKVYPEYEQPLVETVITSVCTGISFKNKSSKGKYDIEVEGNHNYFANNILVHNSGIQKGVGISYLPTKSFFVFGVKAGEIDQSNKVGWLPLPTISKVSCVDFNIYNVMDFDVKYLDIDFNNPEKSTKQLIQFTEEVEECCPVSKALGVEESLLGEGLVWIPLDPDYCFDNGNFFKTKGEKHSVTKVKKLVDVDPVKLENIEKFVEYAATENRFEQGLSEVGLDQKKFGKFIGWVNRDINKEEGDTLESNNLTMKDVNRDISTKAREFYQRKLNEDL